MPHISMMLLSLGVSHPGGIARLDRSIIACLLDASRPDDHLIVASLAQPKLSNLADLFGVQFRNVRMITGDDNKWVFSLRCLRSAAFSSCSSVVVTHLNLTPLAWLMLKFTKGRGHLLLHKVEFERPISPIVLYMLREFNLIAVSETSANSFHHFYPWLPKPQVCLHGLPYEIARKSGHTTPISDMPSASDSLKTVLIVGRLDSSERYKGHRQLIAALPIVRKEVPGCRLLVVGDGDDKANLQMYAEHMGVAEAVTFTGTVTDEELETFYRTCSVFAMPSKNEGFGLVYVEAMAYGKPCIGGNQDAAKEIIVNGETGILVDPDDESQLAQALIKLLSDRTLAEALGTAGFRRYEEIFTFDDFKARILMAMDC